MKNIQSLLCLLCLSGPLLVNAQDALTLDQAIRQALETNHNIRIAQYNVETAENRAEPGMAGLYPRVDFSAGANYSNSSGSAEFPVTDSITGEQTTQKLEASGIETNSYNASLAVGYTVFSGGANKNTFEVLKNTVKLSEAQVRSQIEGTLSQVISAFYQLARLQSNYDVLKESLDATRDRLAFVQNQMEFGQGSSLNLLNAQVDLNADSVNLAIAELNIDNAIRELNLLMGRPLTDLYEVETDVDWKSDWQIEELARLARENNSSLQAAAMDRKIAELNLKVSQASRLPRLDLNASYGYNRSNNGPFSFVRSTSGLGLNAGATLSVPVFTGFQNQVNIQSSEIALASSNMGYKQAEQQLLKDLSNAYATYQNRIRVYELQRQSLAAARANFDRTRETFGLGQATSIQFRNAQLNLQLVQNQINDLRYDIKLSEMELLRLSGQLVQD